MSAPIKTWADVREAAKALIEQARRAGIGDNDIADALASADDAIYDSLVDLFGDFREHD